MQFLVQQRKHRINAAFNLVKTQKITFVRSLEFFSDEYLEFLP